MDSRMDVYRKNSKGVASIAGRVIPEQVFDQTTYDREIFQRIFREIAPYDPDEVLRDEFLNARGAIARFNRGAIEIRVIDVQECPQADLAIAALTIEVLKLLVSERWTSLKEQQSLTIDDLEPAFLSAIDAADEGCVNNATFLRQLGLHGPSNSLQDIWQHLYEAVCQRDPAFAPQYGAAVEILLNEGCLAKRILQSIGEQDDPRALLQTYRSLADCLAQGRMFHA